MAEWIPVTQELPTEYESVLLSHRQGVCIGWHNGRFFEKGASTKHKPLKTITAWMPLPDPYSPEERTNKRTETHECDYISRRAAIDAIRAMQTYKMFAGDDLILVDQAGAMTELMMLPAADVAGVKRGKWVLDEKASEDYTEKIYRCSACNNNEAWGNTECTRFCSCCGAKMTEVKNE